MLVVISSSTTVSNEASLINQLFEEGLAVFHLRKPDSTEYELTTLLKQINPMYYSKVALHHFHYVAKHFGINRLHYTGSHREQIAEDTLLSYKSEGMILSTSVHTIEEYYDLSGHFNYTFLGPVFDSISKPGYKAKEFDVKSIDKKKSVKLIALGGIDEANCSKAYRMGFDGIGVLGSIWNNEDKINAFKIIQSQCRITAQ
ncbi:MAG: thiamine phosphate synthase [Bacteroidota bacterium]